VTIPLACAAVLAVMLLLLFPAPIVWMLNHLPFPGRNKIEPKIQRIVDASRAYRGKPKLVLSLLGLSFSVHFFTAAMYWFTALAIGAYAPFWRVTLASTIQIVATVVSPLTIAGEGVREIVQALMLAKEMGAGASVLSAALGFWAAEALTLIGGVIWLARKNPGQRARDMFQRGNPISENFDDDIHKNNQVTADTGVTG
jgi:hypothetical protein